ncbi:choline/ethanolaminephosphotransferase 1 isoform X1 [Selaginella moellendorffii]|uniref:choline/ethanolaminephosphotransferase 1 isoform X1 n=1 Tax=Selaginella moellendorffii TaxID=88036 RepID=UPI000D1C6D59|nr:choline/ethanolaminephosphotransferase 1 isoform X1 [Selaginella moellendorffii]|eukprot:XP_024527721.1 choline/ethanolaminephosphotransferase 1 isoform X1 [Selaginella moellendorffii]
MVELNGGRYIGKHGLEALHRYKYSGVDKSYMAKYVFQPFWSRFVNLFPLWMPPNMITLSGFLLVVASAFLSYVYSPHMDSPSPKWVHFLHGLLLFLYQTFDAVDGKQARRTNSSSPLGELFDHGCDALSCAFETMAFGASVMSGSHTLWFWAIATVPFYMATWEHYFTNTLILPEVNGPTEGLMLIYLIHFFTSLVGPVWWQHNFREAIPFLRGLPLLPDMPVNVFIIWLMLPVAVLPTILSNVINVYKVVHARKGSMLRALAMLVPFFVLLGSIVIWGWLSPTDVLRTQPHLMLLGSGFAFGYLVGRMILSHLCDEPKGLKTGMCLSLVLLPLAIANALSSKVLGGKPLFDEFLLLLVYCAYTMALYMHFAVSVIREITGSLGIHCFSITYVTHRTM